MTLTCVTAIFNAIKAGNRDRLVRCVESVAKLETEHEHLIYDGASTDGTVELLRELEAKTPGLKVVSEPDTGIYNALNKGVRDAKGEWLYVLGADDYICNPNVLDELLAECGENSDIVATDVYKGDCPGADKRCIGLRNVLSNTPYCHQGVLMRTDTVRRQGGFDENYKIAADYKLLLRCHMDGASIKYLSGDKWMFACFGMSGLSEANKTLMYREFDLILCELLGLKLPLQEGERMCLPLVTLLKLRSHSDFGVRISARYLLRNRVRRYLRLALLPLVVMTRPLRHGSGSR